ncbi:MAG: hypothetical protein N2037_05350 [Acidimicrobiales bacterium]|nr:hypothetical protein [Acidimicrobiales bacterium]
MAETAGDTMGTSLFTEAVSQLEAAGYDSMGFAVEDARIVCVECDASVDPSASQVAAMLRYETDAGEGHVFAMGCTNCEARGLLFIGAEALAGGVGDIVGLLESRARDA